MQCLLMAKMATNGERARGGGWHVETLMKSQMLRLQLPLPPPAIVFFNVAYTEVVAMNAQWPSPSSDSDSNYDYDFDWPRPSTGRVWPQLSSCCVRVDGGDGGRTQHGPHGNMGNCIQIVFELKIKIKKIKTNTKTSTNIQLHILILA